MTKENIEYQKRRIVILKDYVAQIDERLSLPLALGPKCRLKFRWTTDEPYIRRMRRQYARNIREIETKLNSLIVDESPIGVKIQTALDEYNSRRKYYKLIRIGIGEEE